MMKKIFLSSLCACALAGVAAINVPTHAPLRKGGVIVSGSAEAMPHTGYSALIATEKGGYEPLEVALRGVATPETGSFRLHYYPHFTTPGAKVVLTSGMMTVSVSETEIALQIGKEKFAAKHTFQPKVWYDIFLSWEKGKIVLAVDDETLVTVQKDALPIGETLFLGGMPDGMLRNIVIDRPHPSPLEQIGGEPLTFSVRADNANFITFDYFAHGAPLKVRLRPRMEIKPGDRLVLIQSAGDPVYFAAETAGELTLDLPPSYSNRVEIRRDPGNLLAASPLEKFPDGWTVTAVPGYGGDPGVSPSISETPTIPDEGADAVERIDGRTVMARNRSAGMLTLSTDVPVKPATEYLLSVYHEALADTLPGGSFIVQVKVMAGDKQKQIFREYNSFSPLRREGKPILAPLLFRTAKSDEPLTARIEFISDAAPCRIAVGDVSLREYPSMVYQPMPREIDRAKLLTGQALLDHLAKRPAAELPDSSKPLGGVAGYDGDVYKMMARCGADILFIKAGVDHRRRTPCWFADGTYDFSHVDESILHVLSFAPDAKVGVMVGLDPALDFGLVYPDAAWRNINGKIEYMPVPDVRYYPERKGKKYPYVSFTAPDFRRESGKFLFALGEHLKDKPWGKAVVAIHVFGGGDGQWFYRPRKNDFSDMMDFSPGNLAAMREIIRKAYRNDVDALRKAWGDENLTFETIAFPTAEEFRKYPYLRDPADPAARKLVDFARLYPQAITETLGFGVSEFERGLGRKVLKSRYYFGTSLGHLLAESPFDMLVSVPPYGVSRRHGAVGRVHEAPDSAGLYGKSFFDELDLRTSYSPVPVFGGSNFSNSIRGNGIEPGPEGFAATMRKMAAPMLTAGQGYWYLMIGGNSSLQGEYEKPVKESFTALKLGADRALELPDQAAMFWDETARTLMADRFGWSMDQHSTHQGQRVVYRSGVSTRMYLLRDLTHPRRRPAKINIFALGSGMTEEQIAYVEKNLQKDGNVLVFVFDAGRTAPGGFEANIRRLTGMTVKASPEQTLAAYSPRRFGDPLSKFILNAPPISYGPFMIPLYYVDDPEAKPLATFAREAVVGAAVKRHKNWTAVYLSLPLGLAIQPGFIRQLAMEAGMTPFAPEGDVSYAGNGCIVIHAATPGDKKLQWGVRADVLDLTSGEIVQRGVSEMTVPMKFGETRWFRLLKPAAK